MDDRAYDKKMDELEAAREALCIQCGVCCGVFGSDPCSHVAKTDDGRYTCTVYSERLGPRKTVSGVIFTCVTIRDVHKHGVYYPGCAYNRT